jgi:hypothetical protein
VAKATPTEVMPSEKKEELVKHFEELSGLATKEPRATRFIRDQIGGTVSIRGDGDTVNDYCIFLPPMAIQTMLWPVLL